MDYIQGEKFIKLADNEKIFYCHTHNVLRFFNNPPKVPFVLITHNSDHKITSDILRYIPQNLIKWFGQNICVQDERIESIPIGLENSQWFPEVKKIEKINIKSKQEKSIKNLLYINHDIRTNPSQRLKPYELFKDVSFATVVEGRNGSNFDEYLDNICSHKFVLCPEGNGTDTHRTWECLYTGTIPIEKRNINNSFYRDLPICFVNDWSEINEEFLKEEFLRIKNKNNNNIEKLRFDFWKQKINNFL